MFRALIPGFLLGIVAALVCAGWMPVVDHDRVASITRVATNGGRLETFHIELPADRLVTALGAERAAGSEALSLALPGIDTLAATELELFRLRDANSEVIGLASRLTDSSGSAADWLLYLPARGALYLAAAPAIRTDGDVVRAGRVLGGSQSMSGEVGSFEERRIVSMPVPEDADASRERIEIATIIRRTDG